MTDCADRVQVDAALDNTNVSKLARYVRDQAEKDVQFLIISLKSKLYVPECDMTLADTRKV
jgi:hypothetical protein